LIALILFFSLVMALRNKNITFYEAKHYLYNKWQLFWLKSLYYIFYETQLDVFSKEYLNQATTTANSAITL